MKKLTLLIIQLSIIFGITGQTHMAFVDDVAYVHKIEKEVFNAGEYEYELKDSLADGKWILFNLKRIDSSRISVDQIIMVGSYHERLKDGIFYYYETTWDGIRVLKGLERYTMGKKEGLQFETILRDRVYRIYKDDLIEGMGLVSKFFPQKTNKRKAKRIRSKNYDVNAVVSMTHFSKGSPDHWIKLNLIGGVIEYGNGNLLTDSCCVETYHPEGYLTRRFFFARGSAYMVHEYDEKGDLWQEYLYLHSTEDAVNHSPITVRNEMEYHYFLLYPYEGIINTFNQNQEIVSVRVYHQGKMQE